jgi:hypothetical protein
MNSLFAIIILASFVLLIIGFFKPQKSLFWYKKERTGTKSATIYGITLVVSFILFGITTEENKTQSNSSSIDNSQTAAEPKEEAREGKWTEVYTFKGNGMKKSPTFELTGGEARLKYNYRSDNEMGMGMFAAYVVDEGKDIMKEGGIPEVMTSAENEESESSIQKNEGRYYLNINATGNWTVTVEEYK